MTLKEFQVGVFATFGGEVGKNAYPNLGVVDAAQGQYDQTIAQHKEAGAIHQAVLDPQHEDIVVIP